MDCEFCFGMYELVTYNSQPALVTLFAHNSKKTYIMLSTKLHEAINAQINAELWSAYLYLAMSLDAETKG